MLDHTQRLNLHALMGAQRAVVDDVRLWWRLQDQIDLSEEERAQINYHMGKVGEQSIPMWDINKKLVPRAFEFTDNEYQRIEKVVREWAQGFIVGNDRRWLEPVLDQFDEAAAKKVNGNAPAEAPVPPRHRARVD